MNKSDWKKLQVAIKKSLIDNEEINLHLVQEEHHGAFIALINSGGNLICEEQFTSPDLTDVVETVKLICEKIKARNIEKDVLQNCIIQCCIIREAVFLKNPLEWNEETDGICFQWGNKYRAYYMPYEIARIKSDKVRIMDRLCSHKADPSLPSSLWRLPEGICHKIIVSWHK